MSRIRIEDLPLGENLTPEEEALILGAGRQSFRPSLESLENREVPATAIEYGLISADISVAIIAAVRNVGSSLPTHFQNVASSLTQQDQVGSQQNQQVAQAPTEAALTSPLQQQAAFFWELGGGAHAGLDFGLASGLALGPPLSVAVPPPATSPPAPPPTVTPLAPPVHAPASLVPTSGPTAEHPPEGIPLAAETLPAGQLNALQETSQVSGMHGGGFGGVGQGAVQPGGQQGEQQVQGPIEQPAVQEVHRQVVREVHLPDHQEIKR